MKKVIRLTESDLARIVKRVLKEAEKELPVKPDGSAYTIADFTDRTLNSRVNMTEVPDKYKNNFFSSIIGKSDGINWQNFQPKQFCDLISGQGYNTLLQPKMIQTYAGIAVYPPVKYVCDPTMKFLELKPINSRDAELIANGGGIDYRQQSTKHLIKDRY